MRVAFQAYGRVQGVGYRAFVRDQGRALGLSGWVRNEMDGSVAGEAEGVTGALDLLREALQRGPSFARVSRLDWMPEDAGESLPFPFGIRP